MPVDLQQAAWLKADSLDVLAVPASGVSWGATRANDVEFTSPLDVRADAVTEAARTMAVIGGPNVKDRVIVRGRRRDLLFKCVTIQFARMGYSLLGTQCFVIGVAENDDNTTTLTVIRKLTAPAWTPAQLFPNAGVWLDPSDLSTLFKLSTDSTPNVAVGDPVGKILDKSGNGNHAVQATSGARPTLQSSGGVYWLAFDGVDDQLATSAINLSAAMPVTVAHATRFSDASGFDGLFLHGSGGPTLFAYGSGTQMVAPVVGAVQNNATFNSAIAAATDAVYTHQFSTTGAIANQSQLRRDKVAISPNAGGSDAGGGSFGNFGLIIGQATGVFLTGRIYGLVMVGAAVADPTSLETYLAAKQGRVL